MHANLDRPPVVLRQPVWRGLFFLINGIGILVVALAFFMRVGMRLEGALAMVVGACGALLGVVMFFKPTTLTLSPEGLVFINLGIRRIWRWSEACDFRLTRGKSATVVTFHDFSGKGTGRLYSLPARWTVSAAEVVTLLNMAQAKWH